MNLSHAVPVLGLVSGLLIFAPPATGFEAADVVPATGTIEYAFTPGDNAAALIVKSIDAARFQILVQAFSFTHLEIAAALIRAGQRGLDVQVIADAEQTELIRHNVIPQLVDGGIAVLTDQEHASAHNKVMVIDAAAKIPVLITGSFNFTHAAQFRNAENLLVFRGNHELTRAYLENWLRHRRHSIRVKPVKQ